MKTVTIKGRRYKIVKRRTEQAFVDLYRERHDDACALAWNARVPGWTTEDVEAELMFCLWIAFRKFDPSRHPDIGVYWWSIWLNHRASHVRRWNAQKRAAAELPFDPHELIQMCPTMVPDHLLDPPPDINDETAKVAWALLSLGYIPSEVQAHLGLNNRRYYALIDSLRRDDVHDWLIRQKGD